MVDIIENLQIKYYWEDGQEPRTVDNPVKYGIHGVRRGEYRPSIIELVIVGEYVPKLTEKGKTWLKRFVFSDMVNALRGGRSTRDSILVDTRIINLLGLDENGVNNMVKAV